MLCPDVQSAVRSLESSGGQYTFNGHSGSTRQPVVFVFPDSENYCIKSFSNLYRNGGRLRELVDLCCDRWKSLTGIDLRTTILRPVRPYDADNSSATSINTETKDGRLDLAITFVIEYSLAHTLVESGVRPDSVLGHGFGEYAVACIAGALSLDEALHLLASGLGQLHRRANQSIPLDPELVSEQVGNFPGCVRVDPPACDISTQLKAANHLPIELAGPSVNVELSEASSEITEPLSETTIVPVNEGQRAAETGIRFISSVRGRR